MFRSNHSAGELAVKGLFQFIADRAYYRALPFSTWTPHPRAIHFSYRIVQ